MAGFTIPNSPDTDKSTLDQAEPDRVDFEILGNRRKGVVSNAGVTVVSGNIVAVAAGSIAYEGTDYSLSANGSYSLSSAPSSGNRFDLVVARYASAAVTIQTVTGTTSSTNPVFPVLLATDVVLAAVLRRANESIVANDIIDKRAFCLASTPSSITLGTNTTGDYVASLVAGSGITLTNNSGEGATPTIAVSSVPLSGDDGQIVLGAAIFG